MGYKVGDMVVYPRHGAARVEAITERVVKGVKREYLQLTVLSSDGLVINVPVENAQKVGVRDIVDANEVAKVFEILRTPIVEKEMNWSRRYKLNVEKLATGDVNKIAEVVRDLAQRDVDEHGLSAGEKRMLTRARSILTSEIALSEDLDEARSSVCSTSTSVSPSRSRATRSITARHPPSLPTGPWPASNPKARSPGASSRRRACP